MARPKLGEGETERLHVKITADELAAIDDWRFENRIASRSEAVRRLCQIGILVENELEQIVDLATETMEGITDQLHDCQAQLNTIVNSATADVLFGQEEVHDILRASSKRTYDALEAVEGLQLMVLTLYNAIAPFVESETVRRGAEESRKRIDEANAVAQRAIERRLESEENRYLGIVNVKELAEDRERYEALSEDEKDGYLAGAIARLKAEEAADPQAFAEKYHHRPFWQKAGWLNHLQLRVDGGKDQQK